MNRCTDFQHHRRNDILKPQWDDFLNLLSCSLGPVPVPSPFPYTATYPRNEGQNMLFELRLTPVRTSPPRPRSCGEQIKGEERKEQADSPTARSRSGIHVHNVW